MDNNITIDMTQLLKVDDNSITDYETIRQIGLLSCTSNNVSSEDRITLYKKVKRGYEFMGLYPYVMKRFNINAE
jgi:hypothetical protein